MSNEQQKAKELAELLNAFADGKQLQWDSYAGFVNMKYDDLKQLTDIFNSGRPIRIKPETKRIEYDYEDDLVGKVVIEKGKSSNVKRLIQSQDKCSVLVSEYQSGFKSQWYYYDKLGDNFTFLDGTPCYKEVEYE